MPFEIVRNDIVKMHVDVIVNAANRRPVVGAGVDSWIHKNAGENLLIARKEIGEIAYGDVAITSAFNLDARYVIHAVSPVWHGDTGNEKDLLTQCYEKSLALALEYGCESIAFPLLSTGNHGFPKEIALQIAIGVFSKFLMEHEMMIYLVVFDHTAVTVSEKLFQSVQSYIDEHYVNDVVIAEYSYADTNVKHSPRRLIKEKRMRRAEVLEDELLCESMAYAPMPLSATRSLEDLLDELDETFSEHLLRLIDQKGLNDPDVYKKANIDRKLFSKIKNDKDYKPKKTTALAFAFALELSLDETLDLIGRAGYTLTHSSKLDIIVEYFLLEGIYDLFTVNETLFAFEQPTLAG